MSGTSGIFAHSFPGRPEAEWEPLERHLEEVARLAQSFAEPFEFAQWARLAGLWHDLGKYSDAFQAYLRASSDADVHVAESAGKTDHATAGAQHAARRIEILGTLLAYVIAGHHSGLLDAIGDGACLDRRLSKSIEPIPAAPPSLLDVPPPPVPRAVSEAFATEGRDPFGIAFFTRFLFSCLVDADFLATERFLDPARARERPEWPLGLFERMEHALRDRLAAFGPPDNQVDRERARVLEACIAAGDQPPGFFSLTVPTGGGKTLSSLAFALRHVVRHAELRRVIYVAPFTTIIEQNADVFREVFDPIVRAGLPDPVVEHHSNLDVGVETDRSRLAAENWDAPLVVTTAVQFYESLFASRTSRCRKLHRIGRAVIILDEAQSLPVDLLAPCLRALVELVTRYGATVVLCTATQPAIHRRPDFPMGLHGVREIIPEPRALYTSLRRVTVSRLGHQTDVELAERMLGERQVLCVVNTRAHARALASRLGQSDAHFHLSALMCPAHRSEVLLRVRKALEAGAPCRLVSTQLIEAGVDIDFPVVFRSLAGVDSVAQAAGRCNRNGRLDGRGRTFLFESEHRSSERFLSDTSECARQTLALHDDPLALDAVEHYFRLYYWSQKSRWDAKGILELFRLAQDRRLPFLFDFASAAERFRLIEDGQRPILTPWDARGRALCEELAKPWNATNGRLLRELQRWTVQVPGRQWVEHREKSFTMVHDRYAVLLRAPGLYSEHFGLQLGMEPGGLWIC
uniref:CRISPR-associated endonuclease Cas3 n=1 Tax=Eiseniibacteriota bacterium TaxID=2212470 RepID=A0A832MK77_UNCEI